MLYIQGLIISINQAQHAYTIFATILWSYEMFQYVPHSLLFDKKIQNICRRCTIPFFFFPRLVQNYHSYQIHYVLELVSLRPKLKLIRNKLIGRLHWDITKI